MLIHLELFLKLPEGKPPFIGMLYQPEAANYAMANNVDLMKVTGRDIHLRLEVGKDTLSCALELHEVNDRRFYSDVKFNLRELREWIKKARTSSAINFGHVIATQRGPVAAKVWQGRGLFVMPVNRVFVYSKSKTPLILIAK